MDLALGLAEGLPVGPLLGVRASSSTCARSSRDPDRTDDFRELERELYLTATDLDTCERIVFGAERLGRRADLDRGARLDGAADGLQARSRVHERELIDGGIVSTTNLDIAVEAGAKLVVVINPLVPYVNDFSAMDAARHAPAPRQRHGLRRRSATRPSSCWPTSACTRWPSSWEDRYPGVDIILIEPEPDDELMFQTSIMNFTSRVEIARHGFQSVTLKLAEDYDAPTRGRRAPRHRDLGHAGAQGRQALRRRERGAHARLAQDPRADDGRAAAPVRRQG